MTKKEAIRVIDGRFEIMDYCESAKLEEALELAIKALEQPERKKGEWIEFPNHMTYKCSECGRIIQTTDGWRNVSKHYPFCHCGAKMEVK